MNSFRNKVIPSPKRAYSLRDFFTRRSGYVAVVVVAVVVVVVVVVVVTLELSLSVFVPTSFIFDVVEARVSSW